MRINSIKFSTIISFLFFFSIANSQNINIYGNIKDNQNRSIQNASVSLLDEDENNLGYSFTDENGYYSITIENTNSDKIILEVSCLGYQKKTVSLSSKINTVQNFILEEKIESIQEVVIEGNKKIKIDKDTTTIKVAGFSNKTEQTLEDILKKLPGIEVLKDGSIKAHGKNIDKLLIEGEDMFDKSYKLLSKNLDAKVLDAVQIIDNFEDNPILKKLDNSDKVALNLKLKKGKKNIWFGNITLGSGIVSENRWKESLNLGLLKKKIKLFYFGDYNNLGEKATDLINSNVLDNNFFSTDRFEYKAKNLYNINSNEASIFSKSQSIFNKSFLNSLSFTKKITSKLTSRGVIYFTKDNQNQNSFSETIYSFDNNPISFTENNYFKGNKTLASTELELKYFANEKNYITNLFIYKNNPNRLNSNLFFNTDEINQSSNTQNYTFYNHFNHTFQVSNNKVLNNYFYVGNDVVNEKSNINSPFLNNFLNINSTDIVFQNAKNKLFFSGLKSKLISKYRKIDITNSLHFEVSKEKYYNTFITNNINNSDYENDTSLNQVKISFDNALRYNFSEKIDFLANFSLQKNIYTAEKNKYNIFLFNPTFSVNIKKTGFGNFSLSYTETNNLLEINQLTTNFQLVDYRSFSKGTIHTKPLKNSVYSFSYYIYNDEKRFSINTNFSYNKTSSLLNSESNVTDDFNFSSYKQTRGGKSYNFNFSFINYIRKLKVASKIETLQIWSSSPININSSEFKIAKNYSNSIKYSATTYFKFPLNLDCGFNYNFNQSIFNKIKSSNITKDYFLNLNYTISKNWLAEINNSFYYVNKQNYLFNNIVINYNPTESHFSYRLLFNNISNENEYTFININNYTSYKSSINLVPRYLLGTVKYRF